MSTPPPPGKFIVFLFVQEMGGERRLCGFASGSCGACSGRLRRSGSKWSVRHTKYQATMLSCSASSGMPDFNSPDCIVAWYFCGVSWYLHDWDIRYRRCFLGCGGICMAGIFDIADTFWDAVVSVWLEYSLLQMLFSCQSCIIASSIYLFHDL